MKSRAIIRQLHVSEEISKSLESRYPRIKSFNVGQEIAIWISAKTIIKVLEKSTHILLELRKLAHYVHQGQT